MNPIMESNVLEKIGASCDFLNKKGIRKDSNKIGVILGTGMGKGFLEKMEVNLSIDYKDIPNFPLATVEFHTGKLHYGSLKGEEKTMIVLQGRFHFYEGYSMEQIIFPVRVLKKMGIKTLLISNAAGNINPTWEKGDLMLIEDHINLQPDNPLRGPNIDKLGPRFPDMIEPYSKELNKRLIALVKEKENNDITLRKGVYACVSGPNVETQAEYRYLQRIGADAVGMSTVPEVIACTHMNLTCCAISILTDDCNPETLEPISIQDIIATARQGETKLARLYEKLIVGL